MARLFFFGWVLIDYKRPPQKGSGLILDLKQGAVEVSMIVCVFTTKGHAKNVCKPIYLK